MTYGATLTPDQHPLAKALADDATHMDLVRDEYARTKADHEHVDGCDDCTVGADFDRLAGWEFVAGRFLCPSCAWQRKREQDAAPREVCVNNHPQTPENLYTEEGATGRIVTRCGQCRRERSARAHARRRAAKATSA